MAASGMAAHSTQRYRCRMGRWRRLAGGGALTLLVAGVVAACGDTTRIPQAAASGALISAPVRVEQTGNAPVQIDTSSATFKIDDSGSLVVSCRLSSNAQAPQTIALRATLYDSSGKIVGDATGGAVNVAPGSSIGVQLTGPAPLGTIASARFEASTQASPTPTSSTPGAGLGTPGQP